jgi:hypothetical protein
MQHRVAPVAAAKREETSMTLKATLVAIIFASAGFVANSAMSDEINPDMTSANIEGHSEPQVEAACDGYFGLKDSQGIYDCVNQNGSGIMCGGITEEDKNSCNTFQLDPNSDILKRILATARPTESQEVTASESKKCCVRIGGDLVCRSC